LGHDQNDVFEDVIKDQCAISAITFSSMIKQ